MNSNNIERITVAPLVLLSVLDHYQRTGSSGDKRCVGVILGSVSNGVMQVTSSFGLPFEEDEKDADVWFLDHNYIENMYQMSKKINAKERLIGWYHSGPKLKASDLKINEVFKRFTVSNPLLLVVDVEQSGVGLPTNAYMAVEQIKDDGSSTEKTFVHLPSTIEAEEAEEIGVEHLLRDSRDQAAGGLSIRLTNQLKSLKGLQTKLKEIVAYASKVIDGQLPVNHTILGKLQDVFNLLPNLGTPDDDEMELETNKHLISSSNNLKKALTIKTNDELMLIYISNLVRAIIAFDDLIENKIQNKKFQESFYKEQPQVEKTTQSATASQTAKDTQQKTE